MVARENSCGVRVRPTFLRHPALGLALLGMLFLLGPLGARWEEDLGLYLLFQLRGARPAPENIAIVAIDRVSARHLEVPVESERWPRNLHARLIDRLRLQGARVIVFDVFFKEEGDAIQDGELARALKQAGNTVLCEYLRKDQVPWQAGGQGAEGTVEIEKALPPIPLFQSAAAASAPFPLPQKPFRVNQYWLFKPGAGGQPTLPVVAFDLFAAEVHAPLLKLIQNLPEFPLPANPMRDWPSLNAKDRILCLREFFQRHPDAARSLEQAMAHEQAGDLRTRLLRCLLQLHAGPNSRYLNFYGPARSIPTIPYHRVLATTPDEALPTFTGKTVFVGLSERFRTEQRDDFHTVFSQEAGPDVSGVEIAATAFANIWDASAVIPVPAALQGLIVALWGVLLGFASCRPQLGVATGLVGILALIYLTLGQQLFSREALWMPLVVPVGIQAPLAIIASLWRHYRKVRGERRLIQKAARLYLPDQAVVDMADPSLHLEDRRQTVQGVCMATDAARYSRLSEQLTPDALNRLMNRYYAALFGPIRARGGIISDIVGDAMMAVWTSPPAPTLDRLAACCAALEVLRAVETFNRVAPGIGLPTRIGLHCGQIVIGNIGAMDHFEYRAVGDVVNSASRLEGLNKPLRTRILASRDVVEGLEGLFLRHLGRFRIAGKQNPLEVCELIGLRETSHPAQRELCDCFASAIETFFRGDWEQALRLFRLCLTIQCEDGPAAFYRDLCQEYLLHPPGESPEAVGLDHLTTPVALPSRGVNY